MIPDKIYIDIIDMDSGYMMAPSFENNGGAEYIRKDLLLEILYDSERCLDPCEANTIETIIGKINLL